VFRKKLVVLGFRLLFMPPFFPVDIRDASPFGTATDGYHLRRVWLANCYFARKFLTIPRPATILQCVISSSFSSTSSLPWPVCSDPAVSVSLVAESLLHDDIAHPGMVSKPKKHLILA